MSKIILGIVAGLVVWFIGFLSGILIALTLWDSLVSYIGDLVFLTPLLVIAFASLIAGFAAALVAQENTKTPLILSCVLSILTISFRIWNGDRIEFGYYLALWVLMISMTILGGSLKKLSGKFRQNKGDNLIA